MEEERDWVKLYGLCFIAIQLSSHQAIQPSSRQKNYPQGLPKEQFRFSRAERDTPSSSHLPPSFVYCFLQFATTQNTDTMAASMIENLEESIKLELNLARLYTLFNDLFPDDEDFWWQLAMEERGHASLLQQEKKQPQPTEFFPDNLLAADLQMLFEANARILGLLETFAKAAPSREDAFRTALDLELSAGEAHFQDFLDTPDPSPAASIFRQLNQEDRDHAERIRSYMRENGIVC